MRDEPATGPATSPPRPRSATIIATRRRAADFDQLAARADVVEHEAARQHAHPEDHEEPNALVQRQRHQQPVHARDAHGKALVVGDRQDHRHEDRRREAEDVERPVPDRRQLRQQQHREQQRPNRHPAHVVADDPPLVTIDVNGQRLRNQQHHPKKPSLGFIHLLAQAMQKRFLFRLEQLPRVLA